MNITRSAKIEVLSDDVLQQMVDYELVKAHRERALSPDHPVLRGTAQNPDVFSRIVKQLISSMKIVLI